MSSVEIRTARGAIRSAPAGASTVDRETLVGYASTFREAYDMGDFWEEVAPGAFSESLKSQDIVALVNHDSTRPLARMSRGTLRIAEDERGLRVEIDPIDTTYARDLVVAVREGVVDSMSFGFKVKKDKFERRDGKTVRVLEDVELHEVSCVTFPANPNADLVLDRRSFDRWRCEDECDERNQSSDAPERYSGIDFKPTKEMAAAAARGLELRREFNRGGTEVGVARATQLKNREVLSPDTVRRMRSYFARHAVDKRPGWDDPKDPSAGFVAWLLWGGDPGESWSERLVERMEAADKKGARSRRFFLLPPR